MVKRQFIGEMLINAGYVTEQQMQECLRLQVNTGKRIGDIVVEKGYITQHNLMRVLENQHKVPYVDLDRYPVDSAVIKHIPIELAKRNVIAPVKVENNVIYIAIEDPKNFRVLNEARVAARMDVQPMLSSARSINAFIERAYGNENAQRALSDFQREVNYEDVVSAIANIDPDDVASAPIVRLINALLEQAVGMGASDIHIEPLATQVRIRMRVDGELQPVLTTPLSAANAMLARVKILGSLNIAERRAPQDGRFNIRAMGHEIDVRLSTMPTVHGEKAVMRLLDRSTFLIPKEKLGFTEQNLVKFNSLLTTPYGIILITGPTGSGKSTTLYTMLNEINDERDNIITIEDPVEYLIDGLSQVPVNPKAGLDFASGLRAILRQDPDIIMLGEIRDSETVEIAIRAAITGHLVLSTIHTNDAVSTIYRLVDMGVPSYMVAASLVGVVSQRLVRVICPSCKEEYTPDSEDLKLAGLDHDAVKGHVFYKGAGCVACNQTGYKGRIAVHEILVIDQGFRDLVHTNAPLGDLKKYAVSAGMVTLFESATLLLFNGVTTLDEVISITHGVA